MALPLHLLAYFAAEFGLWFVVGLSGISRPFRIGLEKLPAGTFFVSLIECPACLGFWEGMAASALGLVPVMLGGHPFLDAVAWGLVTVTVNIALSAKLLGFTY